MATKKSSGPGNPRRQLVFLDPFSNPEQDTKTNKTRKAVKKWASINRDGHLGGRPPRQHKVLVEDEDLIKHITLESPGVQMKNARAKPKGLSSDDHDDTSSTRRRRPHFRHSTTRALTTTSSKRSHDQTLAPVVKSDILDKMLSAYSDPFDALPFNSSPQIHSMLQMYLNCRLMQGVSIGEDGGAYDAVAAERKSRWIGVAVNSKAAYCALVAYVSTAPGVPSDRKIADRYLGEALAAANNELADPALARGPGVVLAVILLMAGAEHRHDKETFRSHLRGACALTEYRQKQASKQNNEILVSTTLHSRKALPSLSASEGLVDAGVVSQTAWDSFLGYMIELSPLVSLLRRDPIIGLASAHHMFMAGRPTNVALEPFDIVLYACIRNSWHLMLWHSWGHPCSVVERKLTMVKYWLPKADIEHLLCEAPHLLLWVSLLCGALASDEMIEWCQDLLLLTLSYTQVKSLEEAVRSVEHRFIWISDWTDHCRDFWEASMYHMMHILGGNPDVQSGALREGVAATLKPRRIANAWVDKLVDPNRANDAAKDCASVRSGQKLYAEGKPYATNLPYIKGGEPYLASHRPPAPPDQYRGSYSSNGCDDGAHGPQHIKESLDLIRPARTMGAYTRSLLHNPIDRTSPTDPSADPAFLKRDHLAASRLRMSASTPCRALSKTARADLANDTWQTLLLSRINSFNEGSMNMMASSATRTGSDDNTTSILWWTRLSQDSTCPLT